YNRMSRKNNFSWAIYPEKDNEGYLRLKLQKTDGRKKEIISYANATDGKNALFRITADYQLCQKLTGLYETKNQCFQHTINECDGACIGKISTSEYNERIQRFIDKNSIENKNLIIIDRGRNINERSAILVENGIYKGYAFYDLNYQISNVNILKNILIPMESNRETQRIIQLYLRKNKALKIIRF
ncbi:MAG TPA: hypothetical protein VJ780_09080, partial [Flavobacterium sp.]|nr:hypothetical protein [Flavobacterium sp.]